jgi:bifunctional UDP-N-acetylglucosamine pyrophosphorylase/glucosamine-1-phosphate N-acetyltransferase
MIRYSLDALRQSGAEDVVVVVGHGAEAVRQAVGAAARFAVQEQQLGTAHAVQAAESALAGQSDLVLVASADMPLLRGETLKKLVQNQQANRGPITMLTMVSDDSHGFGRIVRAEGGGVREIVEEAVATPDQLAIQEYNVGAYCFSATWLWQALKQVKVSPKGEYYITDLVGIAVGAGLDVQALTIRDVAEAVGINNRVHLAEAEGLMRNRVNTALMEAGVSMIDPASVYVEPDVVIGADTVLWPGTYLRGKTVIGSGCVVGPNTIIEDTRVGDECTILASVLEGAELGSSISMGPFCHLRKGAHLQDHVHMGNFGEVKDSTLGPGTKMGHFSYIGNATIGADVNIGAGTITCNYDGKHKNPTVIGDHVFIGSDTMLVAPVTIGDGARTGAGAVVTHDVPEKTVVVGVPARPLRKTKEDE